MTKKDLDLLKKVQMKLIPEKVKPKMETLEIVKVKMELKQVMTPMLRHL